MVKKIFHIGWMNLIRGGQQKVLFRKNAENIYELNIKKDTI